MDPTLALNVQQIFLAFLVITVLGAFASALKVLVETESKAKAALAFVTALLSIAHFFQPKSLGTELVEKRPPSAGGFISLPILFAGAGALLVGVLAFHGLLEAAVVAFAIFVVLLALFASRKHRALLLLAILAGQSSCALGTSAGRARLEQDLIACGISVGLAELTQVNQAAHAILEDGKISDDEVHTALDGLAAAAKPGLAACVVTLIHDSTSAPPAPVDVPSTSPGFAPASLRVAFESKPQRARRRAETWLAKRNAPR